MCRSLLVVFLDWDIGNCVKVLKSSIIIAVFHVMPDTGHWMLDKNESFCFIQYPASSIQHRFA
jgi:hypothetical protein